MMRRFSSRALQCSATSALRLAAAASKKSTMTGAAGASAVESKRFMTAATDVRTPHTFEQFSYSGNATYLDDLLKQFQEDKNSVDKSWHHILNNITSATPDEALVEEFQRPTSFFKRDSAATAKECADNMKLAWMVRAYEMKGHLICDLDPLGMFDADLDGSIPEELEPEQFGFSAADQEQEFKVRIGANFGGLITQGNTPMKLREIIAVLRATYCGNVGFEFMHAGFSDTRVWFREQILKTQGLSTAEERRQTLQSIIRAERFEKFLHKKYQTHKRFGLDGGESLIAAMKAAFNQGAAHGVENFVLGMPHRGRLNVLVNVCEKDLHRVFNEFAGRTDVADCPTGSGDVKYHLGLTKKVQTHGGKTVEATLLANPSHLECINPLVLGRARAKQLYSQDEDMSKTVPMLLHGDAAFSGQGVCYESMGLTSLENYNVGGCVHIVVNNQIGFTTNPMDSRSASYCTDLAKVVNAPVFHVNGDDPDQVVRVAKMAMDYRQKFKKDVIIDLVCYRRFGHNETDQPKFTQPLMYEKIDKRPTILKLYGDKCVADGVLSRDELDKDIAEFDSLMHDQFMKAENNGGKGFVAKDWDESPSDKYTNTMELSALRDTGVSVQNLQAIGETLTTIPKDFSAHKTVQNVFGKRAAALKDGKGIDWGLAEQMAFATLALEGVHVRLTGQDVERGTFAQRHCKFHDTKTGASYLPLGNIHKTQAPVTVQNSSLSEFGVCGYETGYAMENPKSLVMWEAQFGDFSNGAQVIFDQFLASGEAKWIRQCMLVVSLPHGYDGQGPEHSSGRIERYLQLSDCPDTFPADFDPENWQHLSEKRIKEQNWQVCYPTTAANYFHVLRRQVHREFRKPLINFFSKSLLRNDTALSSLEDMSQGKTITCVLDHHLNIEKPRKIVFCTGQVYSKLLAAQNAETASRGDVALIRLEQLAPFCWEPVHDVIAKYRAAAGQDIPITWAQEEPKNMGAWSFVRTRLNALLKHMNYNSRVEYAGRIAAASPAPGHGFQFVAEEAKIVKDTFA